MNLNLRRKSRDESDYFAKYKWANFKFELNFVSLVSSISNSLANTNHHDDSINCICIYFNFFSPTVLSKSLIANQQNSNWKLIFATIVYGCKIPPEGVDGVHSFTPMVLGIYLFKLTNGDGYPISLMIVGTGCSISSAKQYIACGILLHPHPTQPVVIPRSNYKQAKLKIRLLTALVQFPSFAFANSYGWRKNYHYIYLFF